MPSEAVLEAAKATIQPMGRGESADLNQHKESVADMGARPFRGNDVCEDTSVVVRTKDYGQWISSEKFMADRGVSLSQCKHLDVTRRDLSNGATEEGMVLLRPDLKKDEIVERVLEQSVHYQGVVCSRGILKVAQNPKTKIK